MGFTGIWMRYKWDFSCGFNQQDSIVTYPLVIKHGWLGNQPKRKVLMGNILAEAVIFSCQFGFPEEGIPLRLETLTIWGFDNMIWGYPYFRKPPYWLWWFWVSRCTWANCGYTLSRFLASIDQQMLLSFCIASTIHHLAIFQKPSWTAPLHTSIWAGSNIFFNGLVTQITTFPYFSYVETTWFGDTGMTVPPFRIYGQVPIAVWDFTCLVKGQSLSFAVILGQIRTCDESYHIILYHITCDDIISYHIISNHIISYVMISYHYIILKKKNHSIIQFVHSQNIITFMIQELQPLINPHCNLVLSFFQISSPRGTSECQWASSLIIIPHLWG